MCHSGGIPPKHDDVVRSLDVRVWFQTLSVGGFIRVKLVFRSPLKTSMGWLYGGHPPINLRRREANENSVTTITTITKCHVVARNILCIEVTGTELKRIDCIGH